MILWRTDDNREILQLKLQDIRSIYRKMDEMKNSTYIVRILTTEKTDIFIECPSEDSARNLISQFWALMTTPEEYKIVPVQ